VIVARVATAQHGVVRRRQLEALGVLRGAIAHRLSTGRLHRVHRGVYAVGHVPRSPLTRASAALLACGEGATLVMRAAAALWDMTSSWQSHIEIAGARTAGHRGVEPHRLSLAPEDVTVRHGLRVTTPARTLLDLAGVLPQRQLTRMVNDARRNGLVTLEELRRRVDSGRGRPVAALKASVAQPTAPTRSTLEDAFLAFLCRYDVPTPEVNQRVVGHEVDMLWRDAKLVAELDGRAFHEDPDAFERDRERDADLAAAGFRVIRITWRRLQQQPELEAARLRRLLGVVR
jgi:very-short-patch-repair endonuclease